MSDQICSAGHRKFFFKSAVRKSATEFSIFFIRNRKFAIKRLKAKSATASPQRRFRIFEYATASPQLRNS